MKIHSQEFKEQIKEMGRELDSIITYTIDNEEIELGSEELNSITPHYEGNILKSVMKQLDIDSNVNIPLGTEINYQFGLKIDDEYEYLNYGNYIVYSSEKQEDTNSYKIVAYDKMLFSMVDYEALNITYPITIREYISAICTHLGLTFKNASETFVNYDKEIPNELYLDTDGNSLGYTFRDVLDELAQVTASTICLDENDELEIRYITLVGDTTKVEGTSIYIDDAVKQGILYEGINNITQTNNDLPFELELEYISFDNTEVIDEEYLKDINVNFGEKYGAINTISFKRSADSDVISKSIPENLPDDEKIEIAISDNQILNGNNRDEYIDGILNKLYGLEYYTNDFSSTGICYLDLCDRYFVKINDKYYSCIMFNDEVNITQGLEENIHTDLPSESETDYTKADKTDRRINNVSLIVDKQEQEIRSLAEKVVDVSKTTSGTGSITLENAHKGILHRLEITGNILLLHPKDTLYPSDTLYPLDTYLLVDSDRYKLDIDYLTYTDSEHYDKYVYEDGKQWIERINGTIDEKEDIEINVDTNSYIRLESYNNVNLKAIYLLENEYTDTFASQVEVNSQIRQTADSINIEVSKKVDGDEVISSINNAIDDGQGVINLKSNSVIIDSDNFKLTREGNMTANSGTFGGTINTYQDCVVGDNLYVGQNQLPDGVDTKYINFSDGTFIGRTYNVSNNWESLNLESNGVGITAIDMFWLGTGQDGQNNKILAGNGHSIYGSGEFLDLMSSQIGQYITITDNNIYASTNITIDSDKRLKDKIKNIDVSFIDNLKIKEFEYKRNPNKKQVGLIAQDYIDKDYSQYFLVQKENGYYGIDYGNITNALIQYCQELKKEVEDLKKEVSKLKGDD